MSIINRKDNIPRKGDVIEKIIFINEDKDMARIVCQSGKHIDFCINPDEFVKTEQVSRPVTSKVKTESVKKPINSMTKNSPDDPEYQNKARATLARLQGIPIDEVVVPIPSQSSGMVTEGSSGDDAWKEKAQNILEKSQERASRLAAELSSKSGGRLESSFAGKSTIPM